MFAVRAGHIDAARVLLDAGADVNETLPDGTSALVLAVMNAHYELAGVPARQGRRSQCRRAGVDGAASDRLVAAAEHRLQPAWAGATGGLDSLELVRKLLQNGANVNARLKKEPSDGNRNMLNRIGATPFLLAAKAGRRAADARAARDTAPIRR